MLELAILGLLKEQHLHGYELKKRLTEILGAFSSVSFGSLYPALARLEKAGAVGAVESESSGAPSVPMTGSLDGELAAFRNRRPVRRGGRSRKVYRITESGEVLFARLLNAESGPDDDRAFSLRLAFARFLSPEGRLGLLERRREELLARLARAQESASRNTDAYAQSLAERTTELTQRDISWLDRLMAAERKRKQVRTT